MISEVFKQGELVETCQKITIDKLVRKANKMLKTRLVASQIEAQGMHINLVTSKTRFNGERLWFQCPICAKRVGTLFDSSGIIGCRTCLNLTYKKERYKGMIEML